jgi:hypothetical protein
LRLTAVLRAGVALLLLAAADDGCGASGDPEDNEGGACTDDTDCPEKTYCEDGTCTCDKYLPEPNDPCLPRCGNSLGVGMPCTLGGGECNPNGFAARFCTIDQVPDAELHMCTGPCLDDGDCGEEAVCQGDPDDPDGPKGCVPAACAS